MHDRPTLAVEIAGWRHGCCHNFMLREGAPFTPFLFIHDFCRYGHRKAWMAALRPP
jgi:hypothetical protein